MCDSLNRSKTQRITKDQVKKRSDQGKIDELTIKKSIASQNNSDLNRSESFKPKFTESAGKYD